MHRASHLSRFTIADKLERVKPIALAGTNSGHISLQQAGFTSSRRHRRELCALTALVSPFPAPFRALGRELYNQAKLAYIVRSWRSAVQSAPVLDTVLWYGLLRASPISTTLHPSLKF